MTTRKPRRQLSIIILCLAGVLCLAGCGNWNWYPPSALDQDHGNSVRNNLAQSVLNPQAGLDAAPAAGLGPTAAQNTGDHYNKTFTGEEKKPSEMKISF
ncbi:MAG TPA: hypothetical protein VIN67_04380 [Desulfobaccales bacterium]